MKQSVDLKYILFTFLLCVGGSVWGQNLSSTDLTASMFHKWSGPGAGATDNGEVTGTAYDLNTPNQLPYGDGNVYYLNYADLSNYKTLELVVLEGAPRLLFNRQTDGGNDYLEINSTSHSYVRALNSLWIIDLEKIRVNNGGFVHLNCIKGANYANVNIKSMKLRGYPTDLVSSGLFKEYYSDLTTVVNDNPTMDNHFGTEVADVGTIYGLPSGSINSTNFANLSGYTKLVIAYSGNIPRLVFNEGNRLEINSGNYENYDYVTIEDGLMIIDLAKLRSSNSNQSRLNSIKAWGGATTVFSAHLYIEAEYADINTFTLGDESNCETHVLYQLDPNSSNFTVDLAKFKDKILSYFGKTGNSFNGFGNLYLRWYVIDNTTNNYLLNQDQVLSAVGSSGGTHYKEDIGMLWFDNGYATAITDDNCADVLNASVSLPTGKTATNVTMICVMTDDLSGLAIKYEPQNLKHKIMIRFINEWTAQNNSDFTLSNSTPSQTFSTRINVEPGATATAADQLKTALVGLYNQASASASSLNGATPQYARVYLANSNGAMINATSDNWNSLFSKADSYQNKRNKGYVWAKLSWNEFNINDIVNTVLTKPDGYDWDNVRVVCDLTDDMTGSYFVGNGIMEEPTNLKARLIVSFKEKTTDGYSATSSELTTGMTITRKHYSTATANLDLATSEHFADVNAKFDNHLSDNSNLRRLYLRWYIADKDGEWIPTPEGITLSPVYSGYADKVIGENNYGKVLYLGNAGATVTADMLKMNIQVTNADVDLNDYQVVCALTYADEGYTTEPDLKAKYVYSFVSPYEGKLSDNAITHTKEVIVTASDQNNGYVVIPIDSYYDEIASDFGVNAYEMGRNLHIRWYVVHNDERLGNSQQQLDAVSDWVLYKKHNDYEDGCLYWNTATGVTQNPQGNLNIKFTPLSNDLIWENYKIIAVITNDISAENGQEVSNGELVREPQLLNLQYTFSLIDGVFKFVHHKGASGRDYLTVSGPAPNKQYSWDNENNRVVEVTSNKNIRQGVHTVNYDVFINPNDGPKLLKLPFEAYEGSNGNNLEPMAYIRWYDWASDLASSHLNQVGTWLNALSDVSGNRGLFMLNNSVSGLKPTQARVGVTYDASNLQTSGDIIACDVSKYYDGLYPGTEADTRADFSGRMYPQFVHEPTLSTRYLFHVYPSSKIAAELAAGHTKFDEAFYKLQDGTWTYNKDSKAYMFGDIYENNGRVVVSLNGSAGTFALRADLYSINNYYINNGNSQCDHITWRAYLEDEKGLWRNANPIIPSTNKRIELFDLSNLSGTYDFLGASATSKYVTAAPGMRFHVVGFVGVGSEENAAVHYELQFLDAPAILADNLAATNMKRTSAYLEQNFRKGGEVTFDEFFADTSEPTTEADNMLFEPIPWDEAEYGFCYPTIDKYRIRTGWSGITPIHGDYMLVKSIKKANVSAQCDDSGEVPATGCEYAYHWYTWNPAIMYDYTHQLNADEYGGYIYVDASDESRTIATLDFDASLCSGSQIYFTAAIADLTSSGATSPQLMAHVYANGSNGQKIQVMSFLTSVLNTVNTGDEGTYTYNKWYQVYGHGTVPENIDISNYTSFSVVIDNYSKDTNGADFCVDQIVFYTSTGKVTVNMSGGTCAEESMTFSAKMDVEHLENKMTLTEDPQNIYYRIYEKTGQDASGAIQYRQYPDNSIYNNSGKSYGAVTICKYVLENDGTLAENNSNNDGYEFIDGVLYFDLLKNEALSLEQGKEYFIALTKELNDPEPDNENTGWSDPNDACDVYSNFFIPRVKYVNFLTIDEAHDVVSQIIEGVCGQPTLAHKEYIIQTNYPDDDEPTGFKTLPYGTDRVLAEVVTDHNPISEQEGEERDENGVLFDYFLGTEAELKEVHDITIEGTTYSTSVLTALQHYRNFERVYPQWCSQYSIFLNDAYRGWAPGNYAILQDAISKGKLLLAASGKFEYDIYETQTFLALPVKKNYVFDGVAYILCNYIPFTFTVDGGFNIPDLTLGFDDVDYTEAGRERIIRVGLEQLNKMKNKGYLLHVPVNMYLDKHRQSFKKLYFPQNSYLTISAVDRDADQLVPNTTDPQLLNTSNAIGKKFAKIVPTISGDSRPAVDKTHMYLALDLSECEIDLHEGYQYEVATNFFDEDDEALNGNPNAKACIGDLFLMIKVVPEFVTWKSQKVATENNVDYYSANWYNDDNWQRSTRAELYKDVNGSNKQQNTPTLGHPSGYDNNGEGSLNGLTAGSNPGFVPMKFTYVTMPSGEPAPSLINEPRVTGVGVGDRRQGGGFLDLTQTTLLTDRSPRDPDGTPNEQRTNSRPTENIYYDLLVRYSYDSDDVDSNDPDTTDPFGEGCFGHRQLRDVLLNDEDALTAEQATLYNDAMHPETNKVAGDKLSPDEAHAYNWINQGIEDKTIKVFDCEKYQGNVCHDIYFKPGAELLRQQRLTYQRAWVEIEMDANKWYLLASPLQCTYAGDMYVPTSMTDYSLSTPAAVSGRQVTEAFQPISFSTSAREATATATSQPAYSRTKYPIYQRSWGMNNGNVYTKQNDIRANSYSANLKYNTVTTNLTEWGHTFNDVQVPYHTSENEQSQNLAGFSIRAHKKDQTDKTLIRLPKADTSYEYYDWTDTNSEPAASDVKAVSKPDFDYEIDDDTGTNIMVTLFTVPMSNRLVTDEHQHDGDMVYSISAMQQNGDYVLVGNPYMVSIDMNKFFAYTYDVEKNIWWKQELEHTETDNGDNVDLEYYYYTYEVTEENGVVSSELKTHRITVRYNKTDNKYVPLQPNNEIVRPMQGFFVKKGAATNIIFNRYMQVDGNFPPLASGGNGARGTTLTFNATNSRGRSSASVEQNEKASEDYAPGEDVETLFDSNLADVPMVYTVTADGKAVSINQLPTIGVVPFGVTCNSDEPVEVTIDNSQFSILNSQLRIYDALLGTTTEINDAATVSIQPNDYGRYYLTSSGTNGNKVEDMADGMVISVRNGEVTVTATREIGMVRALNIGGATVYEQKDCGTSTTFRLSKDTYIIEADGPAGKRTRKIQVR